MKKKLSLLMVALIAMAAYAVHRAGEVTTLINYPTSTDGITLTSTNNGSATTDVSYSTVKIKGQDVNCIKFAKSTKNTDTEKYYAELTVEGGFKAGDIITIAGVYYNKDTKNAAIRFYAADFSTELWTTENFPNSYDGTTEASEQTYTLESDQTKLYLGRNGATATCVTLLKVTRPASSGSNPDMSDAEEWTITSGTYQTMGSTTWTDLPTTTPALVKFDGTDVYIQMTVSGMTFTLQGEKDGTVVTFPMNQTASYGEFTAYLIGTSEDGSTATDVVFAYDPTANTLTQTTPIIAASMTPSSAAVALAKVKNVALQGPAVDDTLPMSLTFPEYNDASVGNYTSEWTATVNGKVWTLNGFNNNNNGWAFVRCGRKNNEQTATIISPVVNALAANVVFTVNKTSNIQSVYFYVIPPGSDAQISDITNLWEVGDVNINVAGTPKGCQFKLEVNSTAASANGTTEISKIAIYAEGQYEEKHIANTIDEPYTVAQAYDLIDAGEALTDLVYVQGIISQIDSYSDNSITYWISDDGTTTTQMQCFKGKGLDGADFTSAEDIEVGATVIVKGNLKKFNSIYEFDQGNFIASYTAPGPIEPEPEDIVISPATGTDIFTELAAAEEGKVVGDITINLAENGAYTVSGSIVAPRNVMINGNGATVDASGLTGNMVEYAEITEPTGWTEANVVITGLKVTGLNKALFYSKCKNYYGALTVDNCFVEQAGDATTIDYTKGSTAHTMTVTNSTFYALTATTKSFYSSQGGQKVTEWNGEAIQTFFFHNNTMYNLAVGKNFFSHRQSNQTWLTYDVQNNVFVNCGKSGQTIKGMNGGQGGANPTWIIIGNAFNFEGADTSAAESTGDEAEPVQNSVAGVMEFASLTAPVDFGGVFTLAEGATAPETAIGDPRWTITYEEPAPAPIVLWSSEEATAIVWDQANITIPAEAFADVKVGDVISVELQDVLTEQEATWKAQVELRAQNWKSLENSVNVAGTASVPPATDANFIVTGDIKTILQSIGAQFNGTGCKTAKIVLVPADESLGSDQSIWVGSQTGGNINISNWHFANANNFEGVKVGDIIRVTSASPQWLNLVYNKGYDWTEFAAGDIEIHNDYTNPVVDIVIKTEAAAAEMNDASNNHDVIIVMGNDGPAEITQIELITPQVVDLTLNLNDNNYDIGTAVTDATAEVVATGNIVGNITINLSSNYTYTTTKSIVVPHSLFIDGNGATVDASGLTDNMVEYAEITEPTEWTEANVVITGLKVTGLNKALFYSKCKNYYGALTVDNCFVEQAGDATTIDYTKGSTAHTMTVTNSTFYALTATTKSFYSSQGGQKVTEWNGEAIQTFFFHNNTMYNLAKGKNFFSHRQSNQTWLTYNVQNNVFVNCGKSGQTIKGMNGGQSGANPTWTIGGNVFNFEGADTSANESTGDEAEPVQNCVAGIIAFTSVVDPVDFGGSFTMVDVTTAPNPFPGDPRWTVTPVTGYAVTIADGIENGTVTANPTLAAEGTTVTVTATPATGYELETITVTCVTSNEAVLVTDGQFTMPADAVVVSATFTKAPVNIEIADADITDGNISAAVAGKIAAIAEGDKLGDITITLDGEKSYTVTDPIVAPRNVTINGNGATVDASGLTGNMVEYAEITDPTEWTEANVVITGLKVTGLNKALFYSKCKNYYGTLTVDNCFVEQAGDATTIDYTKGSTATTLAVTNSTFYALTATTKSFYSSQGGQKITEWNSDAIQTFFFHNNTMYNLAKGKNFFSHRQSNQTWLTYDVQNNVFVNCGKSGQTIKGMNGGQSGANPTWIIDGNAFNFEDADTSANESTGDEAEPVQNSVAGVMAFTSVVDPVDFGGVFTLAVGATAPETLGDPRWTITYENAPEIAKFYMISDMNEWSRTAMTEMPFNAETQAYEYEIDNTKTLYFAFSDKQLTEEEESADPNWEDFNTNHRYAIGQGDQYVTLNEAMPLTKVEGTIVLKPVKEGTSYKISVAADFSTVTITGEAAPEPTEDTYVVAGCIGDKGGGDPDELFGTAWNPTAEANQMTKNEETGLYEKVYTGVVFEAQTGISYKIVKNGTQWMPDGDNLSVEIPAAGTYTITFTYNAETGDITGVAVPGADGIQMVNADKYGEGKWYTTSGVEVQKPTTKGLYIHNGKTVVVK